MRDRDAPLIHARGCQRGESDHIANRKDVRNISAVVFVDQHSLPLAKYDARVLERKAIRPAVAASGVKKHFGFKHRPITKQRPHSRPIRRSAPLDSRSIGIKQHVDTRRPHLLHQRRRNLLIQERQNSRAVIYQIHLHAHCGKNCGVLTANYAGPGNHNRTRNARELQDGIRVMHAIVVKCNVVRVKWI